MSFYKNLNKYKNNIAAISETGEEITYGEADRISDELYSEIGHRTLVFCLCENTLGTLLGYISFLKNNIVTFMVDKDINGQMLSELILTYRPEYLWMSESKSSCILTQFLQLELSEVYTAYGYVLYKTGIQETFELNPQLALLLTTSGSTGSPKLVRQSYKNIDSNAAAIVQYLKIDESERPITTLPMNYTYGLSIINSHLLAGATILLTTKTLLQKEFWQFFRDREATSFGGVPYTYEMLKKLRFFNMNLPSLKTLTQAGGRLSTELAMEFAIYSRNTGKRFFVMYGQTEATARMSYLPHEYSIEKCGSMGIAIPGGKFSIVGETGQAISDANISGELVYEGPNVTLGYAEIGEDLKKGDEFGGILYTGDMAMRDEDGFYYITGRKKRFIKLFGNRINLDETERLLKDIVADCACAGQDDKMKIYITAPGKEEEVRNYIAGITGINPLGFEVILIDKIPKNEVGKTIYANL